MYVSGYDNPWIDALLAKLDDKSDEAPARKLEERIAKTFKKATEDAYQAILDDVQDCLLSNMEDAIRHAVRYTAEKVITSALAGDQKTFGELFQFQHDWKGLSYFTEGNLPLGIDLRRKLLTKHHDLFESKAIEDLEGELAALKRIRKLGAWRTMVAGDLEQESRADATALKEAEALAIDEANRAAEAMGRCLKSGIPIPGDYSSWHATAARISAAIRTLSDGRGGGAK